MRPGDLEFAVQFKKKLFFFNRNITTLPGIHSEEHLDCFVEQVVDSVRRIRYITTIKERNMSLLCVDATHRNFNPLKAAIRYSNQGNIDEAFWLVFLSTHFGNNQKYGWALVRGIYGALGYNFYWDWERASADTDGFRLWLNNNITGLKELGSFGNHRKYQSLSAYNETGTGATIESYINWVGDERSHLSMVSRLQDEAKNVKPRVLFQTFYNSMDSVVGFGRTGKFDYLTMIGKLDLVNIEPPSAYMQGATGPLSGAKLLFTGQKESKISSVELDRMLVELENHLGLYFGMQVLEDSLCNWQKNPSQFEHFA